MASRLDLAPKKLAAAVWDALTKYKSTIPQFPQTETCELLIVDRSVDQVYCYCHISPLGLEVQRIRDHSPSI